MGIWDRTRKALELRVKELEAHIAEMWVCPQGSVGAPGSDGGEGIPDPRFKLSARPPPPPASCHTREVVGEGGAEGLQNCNE